MSQHLPPDRRFFRLIWFTFHLLLSRDNNYIIEEVRACARCALVAHFRLLYFTCSRSANSAVYHLHISTILTALQTNPSILRSLRAPAASKTSKWSLVEPWQGVELCNLPPYYKMCKMWELQMKSRVIAPTRAKCINCSLNRREKVKKLENVKLKNKFYL